MKRFTKIQKGERLFGVTTGLADYLMLPLCLVRILFIVFSLLAGLGVVGYIILAIVMPADENKSSDPAYFRKKLFRILSFISLVLPPAVAALFLIVNSGSMYGYSYSKMEIISVVYRVAFVIVVISALIGFFIDTVDVIGSGVLIVFGIISSVIYFEKVIGAIDVSMIILGLLALYFSINLLLTDIGDYEIDLFESASIPKNLPPGTRVRGENNMALASRYKNGIDPTFVGVRKLR